MARHFNTAGPNHSAEHYSLDPFTRIDYPAVATLIEQKKYFVLHAPRQSGKTTLIQAMVERLNREGRYEALWFNAEAAQVDRDDRAEGMRTLAALLGDAASTQLPGSWLVQSWASTAQAPPSVALKMLLRGWASNSAKPIVLLIDEIDSLVGDTLISILRQLRDGYNARPAAPFPQSVILCGVRDVRDYRIHSSKGEIVAGGSCFNVKAESLVLGNFTEAEIGALYGQHTAETGQVFEEPVYSRVFELTGGQPWLVNALAREITEKMEQTQDRSRPINLEIVEEAKERLILRRDTHLDQLLDKLREPRVRRVIEPMLQGDEWNEEPSEDDKQYVEDLGLIVRKRGHRARISNAIYQEVLPRTLASAAQDRLDARIANSPYRLPDGRLAFTKLMEDFQQFFRENSESWRRMYDDYEEAGPQLLMMAFLQRVVNGGGRIEREYALGTRRVDLMVRWFFHDRDERARQEQRFIVELKKVRDGREATIFKGLVQTVDYARTCQPEESHLVLFDSTPGLTWDQKIFSEEREFDGHRITVWGM